MLNVHSFGDESDIEGLLSSDKEDSAKYSDQVSSDVELELYNKVHHSDCNENADLCNTFADELRKLPDSFENEFFKGEATHIKNWLREEAKNLRVELKPDKSKRVTITPVAQKTKSRPVIVKLMKDDFVNRQKLKASEGSSDSEDLICANECGPSEYDLMTNLNNGVGSNSIRIRQFMTTANNPEDEVTCIDDNTSEKKASKAKSRKFKRRFQPITIDLETSDSSSGQVLIQTESNSLKSSPTELQNDHSKSDIDSWHVDPEDRNLPKKRIRRYHDRAKCTNCREDGHKAKFCPKAKSLKCYICGGSHISSRCDKKVCSLCYQLGHHHQKCPNKRKVFQLQCEICTLSGHTFNYCPDIWRRFHATTSANESIVQTPVNAMLDSGRKFCYNCGKRGHLGHECPWPLSRVNCSPSWPYVISYKNPQKFMTPRNCKSAATHSNRTQRKSKFSDRKRISGSRELSNHSSTPVNSNNSNQTVHKNKNWFLKKRKLFFQEQNFLRTPIKCQPNEDQLARRKKKSKNKKKQRKHVTNDVRYTA